MRKQILNRLKSCALLSLLTALAVVPHGFGELVLCQGEDGHRSVELASQGCCVSGTEEGEPGFASSATAVEQDTCGSCIDVVLPFPGAKINRGWDGAPQSVAISCSLVGVKPKVHFSSPRLSQPPAFTPVALIALRTTRLLI